jgi:S1-C subfamily serine protease
MFSGNRVQQSQSLGSGVVVSAEGYILTNRHVIGNARAEVRVTLADGRERPARLMGHDEVSDLAVIKIEASDLPTIPWGDSSKLRVAEWVLAVGNPFQLSGTVTLGIVSTSVARSGDQVGSPQDFIQTDAAINPGNSGGALINARGELVGINTMIYSETGGYQGIGFAIPSNFARGIMSELIEHGSVSSWGSIGTIEWITIDQAMVARYNVDVMGAFVRTIARNSSAYQAGLEPGDTVVSLNGQPVLSGEQVERSVIRQKVGSTIALGVVKRNGRETTVTVPVVARQIQATRRR